MLLYGTRHLKYFVFLEMLGVRTNVPVWVFNKQHFTFTLMAWERRKKSYGTLCPAYPFKRREAWGCGPPDTENKYLCDVSKGYPSHIYRAISEDCCCGFVITEEGCNPRRKNSLITGCVTMTSLVRQSMVTVLYVDQLSLIWKEAFIHSTLMSMH